MDKIEKLIEDLKKCAKLGEQDGHFQADWLLLEFIDDERVIDAFTDIDKWYS